MKTIQSREKLPDGTVLVRMPLAQVVTFWRPGSEDWSWAEEYEHIMTDQAHVTDKIRERVQKEGIIFLDHVAPILLGNDGRVWDGHHRICIAIEMGIPDVMVEITPPKEETKYEFFSEVPMQAFLGTKPQPIPIASQYDPETGTWHLADGVFAGSRDHYDRPVHLQLLPNQKPRPAVLRVNVHTGQGTVYVPVPKGAL